VDAAIATMLCDSVACPDLTGVGGGFLMTVYNRTTSTSSFVNAREAAPAAANLAMFADRPTGPLTGVRTIMTSIVLRFPPPPRKN